MKTAFQLVEEHGLTLHGDIEHFAELVRADERNSWPLEMEAMERQVNILTDALAQEREACAGLCDRFANRMMSAEECAEAIRARGSNT